MQSQKPKPSQPKNPPRSPKEFIEYIGSELREYSGLIHLEDRKAQLTTENHDLGVKIEGQYRLIGDLDSDIKKRNSTIATSNARAERELREKLKPIQAEIQKAKDKAEDLNSANVTLTKKNNELTGQIESKDKSVVLKNQEIERVDGKLNKIREDHESNLRTVKRNIQEAEREAERATENTKKLQETEKKMDRVVEELKRQAKTMQTENTEQKKKLDGQIEDAREELDNVRKIIRNEKKADSERKAELDRFADSLEAKRGEIKRDWDALEEEKRRSRYAGI